MTTPDGLNGDDTLAPSASKADMVTAKALQRAVADLQVTHPGPGLRKVLLCVTLLVLGAYVAMTAKSLGVFLAAGIFAGLVLSVIIITTHDAIHHTLTGWTWFDEIVPRLVSWPVIWVHSIYSEVHKIHHKMNGDDFNDPERVQWTIEEYEHASRLGKFYVRNQWLLDIFVFGGFGLITNTFRNGLRYAKVSRSMRQAVITDVLGIVGANIIIYTIAYTQRCSVAVAVFLVPHGALYRCCHAVAVPY